MTDVHNTKIRSFNMSKIRGKNTKPELLVRKFLFSKGLRYRLHSKSLPGKPDIILKKYRTVIFINGCFWHGHYKCKYFVLPKTNSEWWKQKIDETIERDKKVNFKLKELGWKIITIWECELKSLKRETRLEKLYIDIIGL